MVRVMSYRDRHMFVQSLIIKNLSVACQAGERYDSELRKACEALNLALDGALRELTGRTHYVRDARA